jgi:hypothetical protein
MSISFTPCANHFSAVELVFGQITIAVDRTIQENSLRGVQELTSREALL